MMSLVAKEFGYRGQEIAEYLLRDASVIMREEGKRDVQIFERDGN